MNANIITIGDEILIGQTIDTNSAWMGKELNKIGVRVHEICSISDQADHIKTALDQALQTAQIVLITGGLGPTKDDITKQTLAEYFDSKLILHQDILDLISAYMKKRGRPMPDSVRSLAMLPEKATILKNLRGTAAAMIFRQNNKLIVSMPGVPYEMKDFMQRSIIPLIIQEFNTPTIIHKTLMCAGLGESIIAEKIKTVTEQLPPHIKLAFLPNRGIVKLRFSASGNNKKQLQAEVAKFVAQAEAILAPKYAYGYDDEPLEQAIGRLLQAQNATMSVAESCTGGLISHQITSIAGCSSYYKGGIVAYANDLKTNVLGVSSDKIEAFGVVSEQVVSEMARGALQAFQSDYAVAVSGIAGPTGGTPEKPIGTVWMAVANQEKVVAKKFQFARDRTLNIHLSATIALNQLRKLIVEKESKSI